MKEVITSVGIDIGTSTTQLIFSRLTVENQASSYVVPRIDIVETEVTYRSKIYFTPLLSSDEIDAEAVKKIVRDEYKAAGMQPDMVTSGAVIITGETARKKNANQVLNALSEMAGDFVVATAGPDLESVLSARGAGTDVMSKDNLCVMANVDVGGGTSNTAVYEKGQLRGVTCLDIGGRLIKIVNGKIDYIYSRIKTLAESNGIKINVGDAADVISLRKICALMAEVLAQSLNLVPNTSAPADFYTNNGKGLHDIPPITALTFSGGVADCIYDRDKIGNDVFRYGDIGVLLADAIRECSYFKQVKIVKPAETIRATVVGAGVHTTEISGSTISYAEGKLPIKNIPILNIGEVDENSFETIIKSIRSQIPLYKPEGKLEQIAISFGGWKYRSFADIQGLAEAIIQGAEEVIVGPFPLILIIENDIAKALGHALNVKLKNAKAVICIDGIRTLSGDYVDIGEPVFGGHVLPLVIKTLVFNS